MNRYPDRMIKRVTVIIVFLPPVSTTTTNLAEVAEQVELLMNVKLLALFMIEVNKERETGMIL